MTLRIQRLSRLAATLLLASPLAALAAPTAQSLNGLFSLAPNAYTINASTVPHATVQGSLAHDNDVAWFSFAGTQGATLVVDHDGLPNGDTLEDSMLWLFRSDGQLVAYADDAAVDAGSATNGQGGATTANAYLGGFTLDASDTYYLAVTSWGNVADSSGCTDSLLDGGGLSSTGCTDRSFGFASNGTGSGSFTLNVSLAAPGQAVPEPGSLALAALALGGLGVVRRKGRRAARSQG